MMNLLHLSWFPAILKKLPGLTLTGKFDNPLDAVDFLANNKVNLVFVDIRMPDLSGIEFTKLIEKGPKVVFTTAYEKYAIEGYKLDVVDYLLKPFSYEEFLAAVHKALKLIELEQKVMTEVEANNEFLFLKVRLQDKKDQL